MTSENRCHVRPKHPVSAQSGAPQPGEEVDEGEAHRVEDEFEQVRRGRHENPLVRVARNPGDPTDREVSSTARGVRCA